MKAISWFFLVFVLCVCAFWFSVVFGVDVPILKEFARPENMADLGNSFGVVSAIFSSIAVFFAFVALLMQNEHHKKLMELQRQHFEKRADKQDIALDKQNKALELDRKVALLRFYNAEIDRLDQAISSMLVKFHETGQRSDSFISSKELKKKYISERKQLYGELQLRYEEHFSQV